jgi:acetyl esterase/lipase
MIARRTLLQIGVVATAPSVLTACATATTTAAVTATAPDSRPSPAGGSLPAREPAGTVMDLWPGRVPGGEHVTVVQAEVERSHDPSFRDVAIVHTTRPTLTYFRPQVPNGASVLIIPGGSYQRVVVGKEGYEIANWLTGHGVAAFVLLYRLPADGWCAGPDAPLQDAQRALRLIRKRAPTMGLDPNRVAVMGFSAGGHLAARAATRFASKTYDPQDEVDALSARPDLAALGYAVISFKEGVAHMGSRAQMLGANPDARTINAYSAEVDVPSQTPPTFLMCAADDATVPPDNSILMFQSLRHAKVPAALHIFDAGGHGFGLHTGADPSSASWLDLFLAWSRGHRFV